MADRPMTGRQVPLITYNLAPPDGHNVFRERFGALSDESWCLLLARSVAEPVIDGVQFPAFPNEDLQRLLAAVRIRA